MVNYANGKIYAIRFIVEHDNGVVFFGLTTKNVLSQRMVYHKMMYEGYQAGKHTSRYSVFDLVDKYLFENCGIFLNETVMANSKNEPFCARNASYSQYTMC